MREEAFGSLRRCVIIRFRPKDRAGVADGQAVIVCFLITLAQQIVQRGGVGKGGLFGNRRICALLFTKEAKASLLNEIIEPPELCPPNTPLIAG